MRKAVIYIVMFSLILFLSTDFVYAYNSNEPLGQQVEGRISTTLQNNNVIGEGYNDDPQGLDIVILTCVGVFVGVWTIFGIAMTLVMSGKCGCGSCTCGSPAGNAG